MKLLLIPVLMTSKTPFGKLSDHVIHIYFDKKKMFAIQG